MCKILPQQDLFETMIRNDMHTDFNSFPATIAVERMEAKKAFGRGLGKFCPQRTVRPTSEADFDSFPSIEWSDDDEDEAPFERRTSAHCITPPNLCNDDLRSPQAKRLKLNDCYYSLPPVSKDAKRMLRSRRICTALALLDDLEFPTQETKTSYKSSLPGSFSGFSSSFAGHADVNLEKILQMSFYDDMVDTSVTMVA